ncbi:MAG: hypothetical protein DHS20C14_09260 [Phycisphaeraceae bacterium]|nr:MAG: hypothetical protein DHS20C14_09260 [Phycisphaeraceae bacterium]
MAARTGASVGVAVTITLLGMLCLALFVLTMVFYGQAQSERRDATAAEEASRTYVTGPERNMESVRAIAERAGQSRESVVSYLVRELRETMDIASGSPGSTVAELRDRLTAVEGADSNPLTEVIATREREIASLENQLAQAQRDFDAANTEREAFAQRVNELSDQYTAAGEVLTERVDDYGSQLISFQDGLGMGDERYEQEIARVRAGAEQREDQLESQLESTRRDNLVLQDQLRRLRSEGDPNAVRPLDEASLVDGAVDRVDAPANEVILSIGRRQKIVLGMTFGVFSDATEIRPDPATGIYSVPKAVVEVTRVEGNFSRARIISESRGNPIIRGDVVANAVYDPSKTYKMVVYGLFDRNNDGLATRLERDDVEALINAWGGEVVDSIEGDIDFLILGERPELPPEPDADAPLPVVLEFTRKRNEIETYDTLLETAQTTSVPVLNENRLRTLIGDYPD